MVNDVGSKPDHGDHGLLFLHFLVFPVLHPAPVALCPCVGRIAQRAPAGWLLLLVFALVDGLAGTLLQEYGVNAIGGKTASIASTIEPVICAVLGAVFLHETVTLRRALGIFLIVGATLYLFIGGGKRKENSTERI